MTITLLVDYRPVGGGGGSGGAEDPPLGQI